MAEKPFDARELVEALSGDAAGENATSPSSTSTPPQPPRPLTIGDLPKEMLVSIFMAINDPRWVRHTFPCVCKEWNEIFCSKDASPLHETLEVDFDSEVRRAWEERLRRVARPPPSAAAQGPHAHRPVVHGSRVIEWAERRSGSVRKLRLSRDEKGALDDFSAEDLGRLVSVVGSSLTEFSVQPGSAGLHRNECFGQPFLKRPLWESLRDSVVPAGRLRSLVVRGIASEVSEADVEPLGQLAGSLEYLLLEADESKDRPSSSSNRTAPGLQRFPESVCSLTSLRRLELINHSQVTALPAGLSSLKNLKELLLGVCRLSSLPKELGELTGLTKLQLLGNRPLGRTLPADETFPAELGKLKSLRYLGLRGCSLPTVPAFIGELESLEVLDLAMNETLEVPASLDFLVRGCPRLRAVCLEKMHLRRPWTRVSLAHLKAFKRKLRARNPDANILFKRR